MSNSKRKLIRLEVKFLGSLLEKLPYARLPTKLTVMRRLMLITETNSALSINDAINKVQGKMTDVWTYTGYEDFLKDDCDTNKSIQITASLNNIVAAFSVKYIV